VFPRCTNDLLSAAWAPRAGPRCTAWSKLTMYLCATHLTQVPGPQCVRSLLCVRACNVLAPRVYMSPVHYTLSPVHYPCCAQDRSAQHGQVYYVTRPLGEIVRDVLARGDDRAWMPQESRGAWSEERLAGWRTDPDVTAQLAGCAHESGFQRICAGSQQIVRARGWR
jgi:hypothetical protein